jgi:Asp/Glu/hydantoin racemase
MANEEGRARISWEVGLGEGNGGRMADPQPLWDTLVRFSDALLGDAAQVEVNLLPRSTETLTQQYLKLLNDVQIVEAVLQREEEGYAAALVAPAIDPALFEARSAVGIPVVGSLEAGLALSQFVGTRVGIVAVHPAYAGVIEDDVRRYGLGGRLLGDRPIRLMPLEYDSIEAAVAGDATALANEISQAATGLIEDGADVIVGACQFFGAALWAGGATQFLPDGVPYVDCAGAGLLVAAGLISAKRTLGLAKSEAAQSLFRSPAPELLAAARAAVGLAAEAV